VSPTAAVSAVPSGGDPALAGRGGPAWGGAGRQTAEGARPRRRPRIPWGVRFAAAFITGLIVVAVAAPLVAPQNPERGALRARLTPPTLRAVDGRAHLLGTDHLGRDVLSRVIFGARVSLSVGFAAVAVGGAIGGTLGLLAGYHGGWLDEVIMTVADAQLAFPFILLAIGIIAVLGPSFRNLIIVVGLSGWVTYARVLRAQVRAVRRREFVDAIVALGGSAPRIVLRHILPNVASTFMVIATLELARAIVLEATLSFLGLGIQPPTPSWGVMIQEGLEYLDSAWWIAVCPGLVLMLTSIVVSRTGDWLRDVLDPTLRGV
jgi:peptide/nickel transport system permease protein